MVLDLLSVACGTVGAVVIYVGCKVYKDVKSNSIRCDSSARNFKVVITGGTRGLGRELAQKFLACGDQVMIAGRDEMTCTEVEAQLQSLHPGKAFSKVCDVGKRESVDALLEEAVNMMGRVDIWVNNAGLSASTKVPIESSSDYQSIVECNLLGSLHGSAAAIRQMNLQSPPGGKVFLVDGNGAWGNATPKNAAYGATKRALTQLKLSLAKEVEGTSTTVHMLSPGMVATDLLIKPCLSDPRAMKFIDTLAEDAAVVADWLVPRIRGVQGNGSYFKFLTPAGVMWRFATARSRKGRFSDVFKNQ